MQRILNWMAWIVVAAIAFLALLNVSTLMSPTSINLLVGRIDAPLGLVMLAMTSILVALFFIAILRNQIASLIETRSLLKEMQRVQNLADAAEASRAENLHQYVATEFRALHDRIATLEKPSLTLPLRTL